MPRKKKVEEAPKKTVAKATAEEKKEEAPKKKPGRPKKTESTALAPEKKTAAKITTTKKAEAVATKAESVTLEKKKPGRPKKTTAPAAEEKKTAAKKAPAKKATSTELIIESLMGGQISTEEILKRVPAGVSQVFIKPEENKLYWVKGKKTGEVDIW